MHSLQFCKKKYEHPTTEHVVYLVVLNMQMLLSTMQISNKAVKELVQKIRCQNAKFLH